MQTATLISYSLRKEIPLKEKEKFRRKLLGYKDKSNHGNYEYYRSGVLSDIPHLKPMKSLIIIRDCDKKKIIEILKIFNVEYFIWKILLTKQEYKKLVN